MQRLVRAADGEQPAPLREAEREDPVADAVGAEEGLQCRRLREVALGSEADLRL